MSTHGGTGRRWRKWVGAGVGVAALMAAAVAIGTIVLPPKPDPWANGLETGFTLCGQRFELSEGYVGRMRARPNESDDDAVFLVVPAEDAMRPTSLAEVLWPAEPLGGGVERLAPLSDVIDAAVTDAADGRSRWHEYSEGTGGDGCRFDTTIIGDPAISWPGQRPAWALYIYAD